MKQEQQNDSLVSGDQFERWLVSIGKAEKTASNYATAIRGSISNWAKDCGVIEQSLFEITSSIRFQKVSEAIQASTIYIERNIKGKGMYQAALNAYADYLIDVSGDLITAELQEITKSKTLSQTEKETLISTRLGQGSFRKQLIDQWQGCSVTGFQDTRLLIASHIKPWRSCNNEERLDLNNGLLLLPNIDKAFDLGFISFESNGDILISPELEDTKKLGIDKKMMIVLKSNHEMYMEYHRNIEFRH